jgi:hypothetical protein
MSALGRFLSFASALEGYSRLKKQSENFRASFTCGRASMPLSAIAEVPFPLTAPLARP